MCVLSTGVTNIRCGIYQSPLGLGLSQKMEKDALEIMLIAISGRSLTKSVQPTNSFFFFLIKPQVIGLWGTFFNSTHTVGYILYTVIMTMDNQLPEVCIDFVMVVCCYLDG